MKHMPEMQSYSVPETGRDEMFVPEAFIATLAINVQRDYYTLKGICSDNEIMDWIISNSAKFREAFNLVLKDILADEDFHDAISQAKQGDDLVLREAVLRRVSFLLSDEDEKKAGI